MVKEFENIQTILDRLYRNPLLSEVSLEAVVDFYIDFIRIVGAPNTFDERTYDGDIRDHRCKLPCDFSSEIQVLVKKKSHQEYTACLHTTDTFKDNSTSGLCPGHDYTYIINNSFIFTSMKNGDLKMSYRAIATDETGLPLLPADRIFLEAFEWYIKVKYYMMLWENGRVPDKVLEMARQEYGWAVGRLQNSAHELSLAKMESFINSLVTLVPKNNQFQNRFRDLGNKVDLRNHS
jgi:hypothetical protein